MKMPARAHLPEAADFDVLGLVGVRLLGASPADIETVRRQLGPFRASLSRTPDILLRLVDRIAVPRLAHVQRGRTAFADDSFYLFSGRGPQAVARLDFERMGGSCEATYLRGRKKLPLLDAMVHLALLRRGYAAVDGAAFRYRGAGVLLAGGAGSGKTRALLGFARAGADLLGEGWMLLGPGGWLHRLSDRVQLSFHHLDSGELRALLPLPRRLGFHAASALTQAARLTRASSRSFIRRAARVLGRSARLEVSAGTLSASTLASMQVQHLVALISGDPEQPTLSPSFGGWPTPSPTSGGWPTLSPAFGEGWDISEEPAAACITRLLASTETEYQDLRQLYRQFRVAFPERRNPFLEQAAGLRESIAGSSLAHVRAHLVCAPRGASPADFCQAMAPLLHPGATQPSALIHPAVGGDFAAAASSTA